MSMRRRDFLGAGLGGLAFLIGRPFDSILRRLTTSKVTRWSGHVTLRKGYTIKAGHVVEFDPGKSTTVEASGNIVVYGTLRMRPRSDAVTHTLRFVHVDEAAFAGGGMDPLPSDVGLWVMKAGKLEAKGARKVPWMRATSLVVDAGSVGGSVGVIATSSPFRHPVGALER